MVRGIDKTTSLHLNNEAQFLCFRLDEEKDAQLYGLNIFKIREIIHYDGEVTEILGGSDGVMLGFLSVRGESIPLVDVKRWLHYNASDTSRNLKECSVKDEHNLVIVCHFSNHSIALKVLKIERIIHKNWTEISAGDKQGINEKGKISTITRFDEERVVQILDVEKMISDVFPSLKDLDDLTLRCIEAIQSQKLILIAEDSLSALKTLEKIVQTLELRYLAFPNGRELLDYLYEKEHYQQVGVVITDLEMPVISGFEVLKTIKADSRTEHLPVIINSSMSSDSNRQLAQSLEADGFVVKSNILEIHEMLKKTLS
ncbi:chemotaxis protein [Helicobacter pylori]|uniref:chemotaxis protein n=1 Tax=Helicobacter pylori TaxID=210 RepID=UPI0019246ABF|nr:chemotaxis protein [Helicobacter pylori]QQW61726.1 chemotaxis protein CheV [Helicobacter pylori]QQW63105.1 chemotaxis protein CheV [Helicobacter pylori]QQW67452.1 chemotaxis protein CheV [Helicobacter pylori]QQW95095.1 chemotaxis protein CheV [Helicobacter pylori]QQW97979.1 chemotaxis protein CheV [Helicobacter pylori]